MMLWIFPYSGYYINKICIFAIRCTLCVSRVFWFWVYWYYEDRLCLTLLNHIKKIVKKYIPNIRADMIGIKFYLQRMALLRISSELVVNKNSFNIQVECELLIFQWTEINFWLWQIFLVRNPVWCAHNLLHRVGHFQLIWTKNKILKILLWRSRLEFSKNT